MSGGVSVAVQAELMEKEKAVMEHQQRLESLRDTVKVMANRQIALQRAKRRSEITVNELSRLSSGHVVYQGLGRAFVRAPVSRLVEINTEVIEHSDAEGQRLSQEKQRTSEILTQEEAMLRRAVEEYKNTVQMAQAMQSRSSSAATWWSTHTHTHGSMMFT